MKRLKQNYTLLTDMYQLAMCQTYFKENIHEKKAVFDLFYRKIPNNGGYTVMAGLDKVIEYIQNIKFDENEINYLESIGFDSDFTNYLRNFKFEGDLYSFKDGTAAFPNEPLMTVVAPLIQGQLIETALLAITNGAKEHATGARRVIESTPNNVSVIDMGSRRADGLDAAMDSSIYGYMAGCSSTSNVLAAKYLNIKPIGTQAHSFIEAFPSELEAFKSFAKNNENNTTLLIDTYNTIESGLPNAIKTFKWMEENNYKTDNIGIRIDSGDLAYLSKVVRCELDKSGFKQAKIVLSNGLNANTIESLTREGAYFDVLGVGDNISKPEGRMGCVYKLVAIEENGKYIPKVKLSNDEFKITNPGYKNIFRIYKNDKAVADVMCLKEEQIKDNLKIVNLKNTNQSKSLNNFKVKNLQVKIFEKGTLVYDKPSMEEKRNFCNCSMNELYDEVKRTLNPHDYYVDGTEDYVLMKQNLIEKTKVLK